MKKLFYYALCVAMPCITNAQQTDLSINGGASLNVPTYNKTRFKLSDPAVSHTYNLKIMRSTKHKLMFGATLDYSKLNGWSRITYTNAQAIPYVKNKVSMNYGKHSLSLNLMAGNMFIMARNQITAGIQAGFMYNANPANTVGVLSGEYKEANFVDSHGLSFGAFFDFTHYFGGGNLGLGTTITPKFNILFASYGMGSSSQPIWSLPATIGLHYRIRPKAKTE